MGGKGSGGPRPGSGPPPLPLAVKIARGTARPEDYRLASAPPGTRPEVIPVPPPPEGLTEGQRSAWVELATALDLVRVFTLADLPAFRLMVEHRAELTAARSGELSDGVGPDGSPLPVRMATIVQLSKACANLMVMFGMTPSARDRLQPAPLPASSHKPEADPDDLAPVRLIR